MMNDKEQAVVKKFLDLLARANAVVLNGHAFATWEVALRAGHASNEVVRFCWRETAVSFSLSLTEFNIANGKWVDGIFCCWDQDGEDLKIAMFKQTQISPRTSITLPF